MTTTHLDVKLPGRTYTMVIDPGMIAKVGPRVFHACPHSTAFLVIDSNLSESHGVTVRKSLIAAGYKTTVYKLDATESNKTLETVHELHQEMINASLDRTTPVVALGGGVVGDTAGFAAATFMRGIPLIHIPTTLLAMVDSSIGGKTGVNLPLPNGQLGKNMIGAYWQPTLILVDPEVLRTLLIRDVRCGIAECVKHAIIRNAPLLDFIEQNLDAIANMRMDVLSILIARSASVKIKIVEADEREAGERALLNLGHTFAHAIETIPELDLRHGEAVSIGLVAAAECAVQTKRLSSSDAERICAILSRAELPVKLPLSVSQTQIKEAMQFDKKVANKRPRFILPTSIGSAEIVSDLPDEVVNVALEKIGASSSC